MQAICIVCSVAIYKSWRATYIEMCVVVVFVSKASTSFNRWEHWAALTPLRRWNRKIMPTTQPFKPTEYVRGLTIEVLHIHTYRHMMMVCEEYACSRIADMWHLYVVVAVHAILIMCVLCTSVNCTAFILAHSLSLMFRSYFIDVGKTWWNIVGERAGDALDSLFLCIIHFS